MLAISTVTKKAYIAVSYKGNEFFSEIDANCKQSENILLEIDKILDKNGIPLNEIGSFAVVIGPGSFTGIRIGVALIKGLCANENSKNIIPISTLDLMAKVYLKNKPTRDFLCVLNALSGRLFVCKYNNLGQKLTEEEMILKEDLKDNDCDFVSLDEENLGFNDVTITSKAILDYAIELEKEKKLVSSSEVTPIYIRKAQAEENLG